MSTQLIDQTLSLPPTNLPYDDGEPLETNRHRIAMNVLIDSLHQAYQGRNDYFAGGNMFVYYSSEQIKNNDFRGPDFFAVLNIDGNQERRSWIVWEEQGRYPDVIVELLSDSTASQDRGEKKKIYEKTFKTQDYFVYDPFNDQSLQGWRLSANARYEPLCPNQQGWLWSETLGLWLGTWAGVLAKEKAIWLRFYDPQGNLVLLPPEVAEQERQRANQERERANQERERANRAEAKIEQLHQYLLQLGVDPNTLL